LRRSAGTVSGWERSTPADCIAAAGSAGGVRSEKREAMVEGEECEEEKIQAWWGGGR
jgi:hypothetical protein